MSSTIETRATLDDLYRAEGKAELIGGRIIRALASGRLPSRIAFRITRSLDEYANETGKGEAHPDGIGYAIPELASGRESFSPDASYYVEPAAINPMRFIDGPPTFAVEVRSENDYGPAAETDQAEKRADYFAAGTLVVWDVDPLAECIHVYRTSNPTTPMTYFRGNTAEAEPAVPGWLIAVDDVLGRPDETR